MKRAQGEELRLTMPHGVFVPLVKHVRNEARVHQTIRVLSVSKRYVRCMNCHKTLNRRRMGRHLQSVCGLLAAALRKLRSVNVTDAGGYSFGGLRGHLCPKGCGSLGLYSVRVDRMACRKCGTTVDCRDPLQAFAPRVTEADFEHLSEMEREQAAMRRESDAAMTELGLSSDPVSP